MLDVALQYSASSIQYPASSIQYPASSIQYPASSIQYPASRTWIDGTHDLIARAHRLGLGLASPQSLAPASPLSLAPRPQVGDQRKFYAVDFARPGTPYFTDATCRVVGRFCYIFVEDSAWQNGRVTHTGVVKLGRAFDESTPRAPSSGIYELETTNLGPPPEEIDLDPKIYILVLDIPDNYAGLAGTYVAGYFEPVNQRRGVVRDPNTGMKLHSNEVEMVYIDADPLDIGSITSMEVLAHEFQHLIHWRHDPNEDLWINEGCSDYAALFLCGYGSEIQHTPQHVEAFEREPQTSLVYWPNGVRSSLAHYGAAYLWMVYLHEQYGGTSTISSLITHPANGINGINAVLSGHGYSQDFRDVFSDWKIANFLDDVSFASGKYGYMSLDLRVGRSGRHSSFPISNVSRYIQSWAADYIEFTGGNRVSDLQIDFAGRNPAYDFDVRAIAMRDGQPVAVESVQVQVGAGSGHISIPEFGYAIDTVVFIPNWQPATEADFDQIISYSYSARLGEEVSFEVAVLPNAIFSEGFRYVDIIVQFDEAKAVVGTDVPRITITRLGETLTNEQNMVPIGSFREGVGALNLTPLPEPRAAYVYQLYVPHGWDGSEIKWDISYLGRSLSGGNLDWR
jgi:hypothetical protein